jgi:hypothetical protein
MTQYIKRALESFQRRNFECEPLIFEHSLDVPSFTLDFAPCAFGFATSLNVLVVGRFAESFLGLALHFAHFAFHFVSGTISHKIPPVEQVTMGGSPQQPEDSGQPIHY